MSRIRMRSKNGQRNSVPHSCGCVWFCCFSRQAAIFPGRPKPADKPVPADQVVDFVGLYRQNCAGCHGADGKLGPAPPLNDPIFLSIVPDSVAAQCDQRRTAGNAHAGLRRERGGFADRRAGERPGGRHQAAMGRRPISRMVQRRPYSVDDR